MRALILAALLLLLALPRGARAAYEDLGAGARAPGMANAFVPVADDVFTIHYNPAGLGLLERPQLGTAYTLLYPGLQDGSNLSSSFIGFAQPLAEGRQGALGVSWESFSLNNLYREDQLSLSYGRLAHRFPGGDEIFAGATARYLSSSFGGFPEATNAVPTGGVAGGGQADPLLTGSRTQSAMDGSVGVLHRFGNHFAWGAAFDHVTQPNVSYSKADADKLPLTAKLGFGYRSLISNLAFELDTKRGPTGARDNTFNAGAERWFPKLFVGDFGLRGGLSLGSRDLRQVNVGASYRSTRIGVDYTLALPLGGLQTTVGSHRVALTFRFGRRTEKEESLELVLEAMKQVRAGQAVSFEKRTVQDMPRAARASLEELLGQTRALEDHARYAEALDKLGAALTVAPADKDLVQSYGRLNFVGKQIKQLPDYKTDPMQATLHLGLLAYLKGSDEEAVLKVAQASAMAPGYRELEIFLAQLSLVTGVKAPALSSTRKQDYQAALKLTRANSAIEDGDYTQAIELSRQVLQLEPDNASAWQNLGTAYFALKDYESSLRAWKRAYTLEKSSALRAAIRSTMRSVERARDVKQRQAAAAPPPQAPPLPARPTLSPQQEDELFNRAVDAYTRRDFQTAKSLLEQILQADPDNVEAQKALRRVKEELP